jgi:hypothetical protein
MIYGFRRTGRRASVVPGKGLNVAPKWKQPSFEIVLRGVWVELAVIPDPYLHLPFRVDGVDEVARTRVNVRQRNHGIRWNLSISQKVFDCPPKLFSFMDSSLTWEEIDVGHSTIEPAFQELQQMRLESLLSPSFD